MAKDDPHLRDLIGQMEALVADFEKWGRAFRLIALTDAPLEGDAIYVMAVALEARARELMALWKAAFHAAHGPE